MEELNDEEFNDALAEVIGEVNHLLEETPSNYQNNYRLDQIIAPLEVSIDNFIDRLCEAFEKNDTQSLTETELDEYL